MAIKQNPGHLTRSLQTKYYVNKNGKYLGAFTGIETVYSEKGELPGGARVEKDDLISSREPAPKGQGNVEVPTPPEHGSQHWNGSSWDAPPPLPNTLGQDLAALAPLSSLSELLAVLQKHFPA